MANPRAADRPAGGWHIITTPQHPPNYYPSTVRLILELAFELAVLGQVRHVHGVLDLVFAELRAQRLRPEVTRDVGIRGTAEISNHFRRIVSPNLN
jgi:hypothetical protein